MWLDGNLSTDDLRWSPAAVPKLDQLTVTYGDLWASVQTGPTANILCSGPRLREFSRVDPETQNTRDTDSEHQVQKCEGMVFHIL